LLAVLGLDDEASAEVAALRGLGRMGQNEAAARRLEARLKEIQAQRRTMVAPNQSPDPASSQSARPAP